MSPITKETYTGYLPKQHQGEEANEVVLGGQAELDMVTALVGMKVQDKLLQHVVNAHETDFRGLTSIVKDGLMTTLSKTDEELTVLSEKIDAVRMITRPANSGTDYTYRDVDKLKKYQEVLWLEREALRMLIEDDAALERHVERLIQAEGRAEAITRQANDVLVQRGEPAREKAAVERQLNDIIGKNAVKFAQ